MTTLWQQNGGAPGPLPVEALGADGHIYTDLANNAVGLQQCGFTQAPAQPSFDPATQECAWQNGAWVVQAIPPPAATPPSTISSRDDFLRLFPLTTRGQIATSTDPMICAFRFEMTVVTAVDRADQETINAVNYMTSTTPALLTSAQAAQILAGTPAT